MKKIEIKESKTLLEVRRIKEKIAREADSDAGYYLRLNDSASRLLSEHQAKRPKLSGSRAAR